MNRSSFFAAVVLCMVSSAASLPAVEVEYYWARVVGDNGASTPPALTEAGEVSFNVPQTFRTAPAVRSYENVTFLEDLNYPIAVVTDMNPYGIAVGYVTDETGDMLPFGPTVNGN